MFTTCCQAKHHQDSCVLKLHPALSLSTVSIKLFKLDSKLFPFSPHLYCFSFRSQIFACARLRFGIGSLLNDPKTQITALNRADVIEVATKVT